MGDEMLPFKKGAFHLAIEGQLPVLPIVYSSYRGFLSHPLKIFNPGIPKNLCLFQSARRFSEGIFCTVGNQTTLC